MGTPQTKEDKKKEAELVKQIDQHIKNKGINLQWIVDKTGHNYHHVWKMLS